MVFLTIKKIFFYPSQNVHVTSSGDSFESECCNLLSMVCGVNPILSVTRSFDDL
jgi:hypothetical protein